MFRKFVIKVMKSYEGQRQLESALRSMLDDPASPTRAGLMRVVRGVAKDAVEEAQEGVRELVEMDGSYQHWAQQRRQAILEREAAERAAIGTFVRTGEMPQLPDPFEGYVEGREVLVIDDALFERRKGRILRAAIVNDYPEVEVLLDGYVTPLLFTPRALQLLALEEPAAPAPAAAADMVPTQLLPTFNEQRIAELRAAGLSEESAVAMAGEE